MREVFKPMIIHVVSYGETLFGIAQYYGISLINLLADNGLNEYETPVVGQALVIQQPELIHTVKDAETIYSIAAEYGTSVKQIYRNNLRLGGMPKISAGDELIISYVNQGQNGSFVTNSYAYPYISRELLNSQLPYLSYFTPFTYGISSDGETVDLADAALLDAAREYSVQPLMHLSTLTEGGVFSNDRASMIFENPTLQSKLISETADILQTRGYRGLDVDFEFIYPEERYDYVEFLQNLRLTLNPYGYPLFSALAPKTSDTQRGTLYEGHDYAGIGAAVNGVLLMTYEWGYTYGPPMAVAPLNSVRRVAEYAITRISPRKLFLGIPTYGYDWILPYERGNPGAPSISPTEAVDLARRHGTEIQYDTVAQSPWFRYADNDGRLHEVWFEDARSIEKKLALANELKFVGIGYWNLMRSFPQNWAVLNNQYKIEDNPSFLMS